MEGNNIDLLDIMIAEISRLVEEKDLKKGYELLTRAVEEIEKIRTREVPPIVIFNLSVKIINLLQFFQDQKPEKLLERVKKLLKESLDLKDIDQRNLYARFLAFYSQVAHKLNINPLKELKEAEEIFYQLATNKGLVKQYAAFVNLFYAPIMKQLGHIKKALKSLEAAVDELYHYYRQSNNKTLLASIGEIYAHEALILYEVGDVDNSIELFEQALDFFMTSKGNYGDYKRSICLNLLDLYNRRGRIGKHYDYCKRITSE